MPKKAVFIRDVEIPDGPCIPKGTEAVFLGKYVNVIMNGEEYSLPGDIIEDDGTFKTTFITLDDKVYKPGDKMDVVRIIAEVECMGGICGVETDNLLITE